MGGFLSSSLCKRLPGRVTIISLWLTNWTRWHWSNPAKPWQPLSGVYKKYDVLHGIKTMMYIIYIIYIMYILYGVYIL
jgi:hypothetical protein